ncbi:hypothetical protein N7536_006814 [Penicillium majusculum]|nr:hypothetical protein N7536_006814 [Penicillium majusculum]
MIVRTVVSNNKSADQFSKTCSTTSRCPCSRQVNITPSPRCRPIEGRILPNWGIDISSLAEEAVQQRPCRWFCCGLRIDTDPVVFQKKQIDLVMEKAFHIPGVSRRGLSGTFCIHHHVIVGALAPPLKTGGTLKSYHMISGEMWENRLHKHRHVFRSDLGGGESPSRVQFPPRAPGLASPLQLGYLRIDSPAV